MVAMNRSIGHLSFSILYLIATISAVPSWADESTKSTMMAGALALIPKDGEEIEFHYLGKWTLGLVLEVKRGRALVEYQWSGKSYQKEIELASARYPWQANTISPAFVWKDTSGGFSIKAAVIDIDNTNKTVTFYRIDTNNELTLPIDKLGAVEQARIQRINASKPLKVVEAIPAETFATFNLSINHAWSSDEHLGNVASDPPVISAPVCEGGAAFPKVNFWDSLISVYPIGSEAGWIAAATGSSYHAKEEFPGRLIWATLKDGKVHRVQSLPHGQHLSAVDPGTQRALTISSVKDPVDRKSKKTLTVWNASPKTEKAMPLISWFSDGDHWSGDPIAEFVGGNRVLHRWGSGRRST